jgi:titin
VNVGIGDISAKYSTISNLVLPFNGIAGNTITFTLELYDIFNNKFVENPKDDPEIIVEAVFNNANSYISPIGIPDLTNWQNVIGMNFYGIIESNNDGTFKVYLTILKAGTFDLNITLKNNPMIITSNTINIIPNTLDASKCVYQSLPVNYQSGTQVIINVQCRDLYYNNIAAPLGSVMISSSIQIVEKNGTYNESGAISDIVGSPGCFEIKFTPIKATTFVSKFLLNNIGLPEFTFNIIPNTIVNTTYTTTYIDNFTNTYIAGSKLSIYVKSYDSNNNLILSDTTTSFDIIVTGLSPAYTNSYTPTNISGGVYKYDLVLTTVNHYNTQVQLAGVDVLNSPFNNIMVVNAKADGLSSKVTQSSNTITAGLDSVFIVKLYDIFGNLIQSNTSETVFLEFQNQATKGVLSYPATYTVNQFESNVDINTAGIYSFIAGLTNNGGLLGRYYKNINFSNSLDLITLKTHQTSYYTRIDPAINFDIGFGQYISNYPNSNISIEWTGFIKPTKSEWYKFSYEVNGDVAIFINYKAIDFNNPRVFLDSTVLIAIKIQYSKSSGRNLVVLKWQGDSMKQADVIPSDCLYFTTYSNDTPITVTVNASTSTTLKITSLNYDTCIAGQLSSIQFQVYDSFNNLQTHNLDTFTAAISNQNNLINPVISSLSPGSYKMDYTINQIGVYSLLISMLPNGQFTSITFDDFNKINCISKTLSVVNTVLSGSGLTVAIAGEVSKFKIQLYDANNNPVSTGNDIINVSIISPQESVNNISITYTNSEYDVNYIAYTTGSPYIIKVIINNDTANSFTSTMNLSANVPSYLKSFYQGLVSSYNMNTSNSFQVILRDEFNNAVNSKSYIYVLFEGDNWQYSSYGIQVNDIQTVNFNIPNVSATDTGCGLTKLKTYVLTTGIQKIYYNNYWLSGNPINKQIDSIIDFNWPNGTNLAEGINKLYTSVSWSGYILAKYSETYSFIITTSNNIRVYIDDLIVIDSFGASLQSSYTISKDLMANKLYKFTINLYIAESVANIKLEWVSTTQAREVIPADKIYTKLSDNPVNSVQSVNLYSSPSKITDLTPVDTFSATSIELKWSTPQDIGCDGITNYSVKRFDGVTYVEIVKINSLSYTDSTVTANNTYKYVVTALNTIGESIISDPVSILAVGLSNAPGIITVVSNGYSETSITLNWTAPTDTGLGDTSIPVLTYKIEYRDSSFSSTFDLIGTTNNLFYTVSNLIAGRTYDFRIRAETLKGLGAYTPIASFSPMSNPGKPLKAPASTSNTNKTQIEISYLPVTYNAGSSIINYNVYIDDGNGNFGLPINNSLNTTYLFTGLTTGKLYQVKFTAVNSAGEGQASDISYIYTGILPTAPQNLIKTLLSTSTSIAISWVIPVDNGGIDITGYNIYNNGLFIANVSSSVFNYKLSNLKTSQQYTIEVSAVNAIGEGPKTQLITKASGIPGQVSPIELVSSDLTTISVQWTVPFNNGGETISDYDIRINNGPGTNYQSSSNISTNSFTFNGLSNSILYYSIQVRANNVNGSGPWSNFYTFVTAKKPSIPQNFAVDSQDTSYIQLKWLAPSDNGGCNIYGYKLFYKVASNNSDEILLYDGSTNPTRMSYLFNYINRIKPSTKYTFRIFALNCGFSSDSVSLSTYSAKIPDPIAHVRLLSTIDNQSVKITWDTKSYNGGMPITSYKIYINNLLDSTITNLSNVATLNNLILTTHYKITLTATNVLGESDTSVPFDLLFSNPPTPPQNFLIKPSIDNVQFKWDAPLANNGDDLIGYRIYLSHNGQYELIFDSQREAGMYTFNYSDNTMTVNENYQAYIVAYNSSGESQQVYSNFLFGDLPGVPYGLKVKLITPNGSIVIEFNPPTYLGGVPLTGFVLNKDNSDLPTVINATDNTVTDNILGKTYGDTITYKLKATNLVGAGLYSLELHVTVGSVPNAPSNLKVTYRNKDNLTISWDLESQIANNAKTLSYVIIIKETLTSKVFKLNTIPNNSYNIDSLTPGTQYDITVRASNTFGESLDSNILSITAGDVPDKITNLTSSNPDGTSVVLSFDAPEDDGGNLITGYNIYYDDGQTGTFSLVSVTSTSHLIAGLTSGNKLNVKITAVNIIGESSFDIYTFTVGTIPDPPTVNIVNRTINGNFVNLQVEWVSPLNTGGIPLKGYKLFINNQDNNNPDKFYLISDKIYPWNTSYTIYNLIKGKSYIINLIATNAIGNSIDNFLNVIAATAPNAPEKLQVNSSDLGLIKIQWNPPSIDTGSAISSYNIYYKLTTDPTYTKITTSDILTTYTINGLTNDGEYQLYVSANNDIGEGNKSNLIDAFASSVPTGLGSLSVNDNTRTYTSVELNWSTPTSNIPIIRYDLYRDNGNNTQPDILCSKVNKGTSTVISNLINGAKYNFAYKAINLGGESQLSAVTNVSVGKLPNTPINIKLVTSSSSSIDIQWDSPNDIGGDKLTTLKYNVYVDSLLVTTTTTSKAYSLTGFVPGSSHDFILSAVNDIGEGAKSPIYTFKAVDVATPPVLSIGDSSSSYCTVNWTPVTAPPNTSILGYKLYIDKNGSQNLILDTTNNPAIMFYTIRNLIPNNAYTIYGSTINQAGESPKTNITCSTIPIPGQPGEINLISSSITNIEVSWSSPLVTYSQILSFKLYARVNNGTANPTTINSWNVIYTGTQPTYNLSVPTPLTYYDFKVTALDINNREGPASIISSYYAASLPPKIAGLTLTNTSKNSINILWTIPSLTVNDLPIIKYLIYSKLKDDINSDFTVLEEISNINQFEAKGLQTGLEYSFKVSAVNDSGEGALSDESSLTAKYILAKPDSPILVSISPTSSTLADIDIKWGIVAETGGVPITGYQIQMTEISTNTISIAYNGSNDPITLSTTITGLNIGENYEFRLAAMNPDLSLWSDPLSTIIAEKPSPITSITVTMRTETTLKVTWPIPNDGGSAIINYTLKDPDSDSIYYVGSTNSAILTNLLTGSVIKLVVFAANIIGDSDISDIYQFKVYGVPHPPTNLELTSASKTSISFKWYTPSNNGGDEIASYKIYREDSTLTKTLLATVGSAMIIYTDNTVTAGESYKYYITALNSFGQESEFSDYIVASAISIPTGMNTIKPALFDFSIDSLTINWAVVPDNGGDLNNIKYNLYYRSIDMVNFIKVYSGNQLHYRVRYLNKNSSYIFKITAENSAGISEWSQESDILRPGIYPSMPTGLTLQYRDETTIIIQWDMIEGIYGYNVYLSTDSGSTFNKINTINNYGITSYTYSTAIAGDVYVFALTTFNDKGESDYSINLQARAGSIPKKPNTALIHTPSILNSSIFVNIPTLNLLLNGGSSITGYVVSLKDGISEKVVSNSLNQNIVIDNLVIGNSYIFRYAARNEIYDKENILNLGLNFSDTFTVLLADVPLQVTELTYRNKYADRLTLQWKEPDNNGSPILNYNIEITDNTFNLTINTQISNSVTYYVVNNLIPGNNYSFTVNAENSIGTCPNSEVLTLYSGLIPIQMSAPVASALTRNSVILSWNLLSGLDTGGTATQPLNIINYNIYMRNLSTSKSQFVLITSTNLNTYTVNGLVAGNSYEYYTTATNIIGESLKSSIVTVNPGTYPSSPTGLKVANSSKLIKITWLKPLDNGGLNILYYEITIDNVTDNTQLNFSNILEEDFVFDTNQGLLVGKEYSIKIRAHNLISSTTGVNPNWSNSITAYSSDLPKSPVLIASNILRSSADLNWNFLTTSLETGYSTTSIIYILEIDNSGDNNFRILFTTSLVNFYNINIPYVGKTYNFRLRSQNNVGLSSYSQILTVVFGEIPSKPDLPTLLSRSGSSTNGYSPYVELKWAYPSDNGGLDITGYKIEMSPTNTFPGTIVYEDDDQNNFHTTIYNLVAGNDYYFVVYAKNSVGYSPASDPLYAKAATVPDSPDLIFTSSTKTSITIDWTAPTFNGGSIITGYKLAYNNRNVPAATIVDITDPNILTYTITGLTTGLYYEIKVAGVNSVFTNNYLSKQDDLNYSDILVKPAAIAPSASALSQDVSNADENSISLTWTVPTDDGGNNITKYVLLKEFSAGVWDIIYEGFDLTFKDKNLQKGSTYNYKLYSVNDIGNSIDSNILAAFTGTVPSQVADISVTGLTSTSFTLNYVAPYNGGLSITNYYIISNSPISNYSLPPVDNGTSLSYVVTVPNTTIGQPFNFKVYAANILGSGAPSQEFTVYPCDIPSKPSLNVLLRSKSGFTIGFSAPTSNGGCLINKYELYINSGIAGSPFNLVQSNNANIQVNTHTFNNLEPFQSYQVKVIFYNQGGLSNFISSTILVDTLPNPPFNIKKTSVDNLGNLSIQWENDTNVSSNDIFIDDGHGNYPASGINYTNMNNLTYGFTGLTVGLIYKVKIYAQNSIGISQPSNEYYFTIASPPDPPTNLISDTATKQSISITWTPPVNSNGSPVVGYNVYMLTDGNFIQANFDLITNISFITSGLTTGIEYFFKVTAVNAAGESVPSSIEKFVCADLPNAPSRPFLISSTLNSIEIGWTYNTDDGGSLQLLYEVWGKMVLDNNFVLQGTTDINTLDYLHGGLTVIGDYQYKIRALTERGYSNYSAISTLTLGMVPTVLTAPSIVQVNTNSVTIAYKETAINGLAVLFYKIFMKDATINSSYSEIEENPLYMTTFMIDYLVQGHSYIFKFRAVNKVGESLDSPDSAIAIISDVPSQPLPPIAIVKTTSSTTIDFTFNQNIANNGSPIIKYTLYINDGMTLAVFNKVNSYDGQANTFSLDRVSEGLALGRIYSFRYSATNSSGESQKSDITRIAFASLPPQSNDPTVDYTSSSSNYLRIEWNSIIVGLDIPIIKNSLFMDDGNNGEFTNICNVNTGPKQVCYVNTLRGRQYKFYTNASNFNGTGKDSNIVAFYSCSAPRELEMPKFTSATQTSILISWAYPLDDGGCSILSYEIYRDDADNKTPYIRVDQLLTEKQPNLFNYAVGGLTSLGNVYQFTIKAVNAIGSISSSTVGFTLASIPSKPAVSPYRDLTKPEVMTIALTPLTTTAMNGGSPIISYELKKYNGLSYQTLYGLNINSLAISFVDKNALAGNEYKYIYRARNINGWGDYSYIGIIKAIFKPSKPTNLIMNSALTTTIVLGITPLQDFKGSSSMTYEIWMDQGAINTTFSNLGNYNGADLTYSVTNAIESIVAGKTYGFKIRAKNELNTYSDFR